jgi:hypothetical protein
MAWCLQGAMPQLELVVVKLVFLTKISMPYGEGEHVLMHQLQLVLAAAAAALRSHSLR